MIEITNDNFEEEVLAAKVPVLLDFYADWCEPCKMQTKVLQSVESKLGERIKIGKVNVDEQAAMALKYQIMSIPTLILMNFGIFSDKKIGFCSEEEIYAMLDGLTNEAE